MTIYVKSSLWYSSRIFYDYKTMTHNIIRCLFLNWSSFKCRIYNWKCLKTMLNVIYFLIDRKYFKKDNTFLVINNKFFSRDLLRLIVNDSKKKDIHREKLGKESK